MFAVYNAGENSGETYKLSSDAIWIKPGGEREWEWEMGG